MMEAIFWTFLGLGGFIYFGYPAVLFILGLFRREKRNPFPIFPEVTLIIPVHNEERVIGQKIRNISLLDYPKEKLEVIFALDGCTDKTEEIITRHLDGKMKIIKQNQRNGKAGMLNKAVSFSSGDIIVFTDANTIFRVDAVKKLVRQFSERKVGCVCGDLRYFSSNDSSVAQGEGLYWRYERSLKIRESWLGSLLVSNGSIYAIRKELFQPIDLDIADDFILPMQVAKKGFKVLFEPEAVAEEKITQNLQEEFRQKTRIITQGLKASIRHLNLIRFSGLFRLFCFLMHKFLRWLVPLFLMGIFISNLFLTQKAFYKFLFIIQILFYLSALAGFFLVKKGRRLRGILYIPFYFSLVNLASLVGIIRFFRKERTDIWEKAETTR